ncbi:Fur family transcriptional regulator [Anaerotalea alkaliphila]|uniref:Transcriptional repressor n=1 Tax=Anaerotalea alkaliphila TaxID=2662126 RepID=A0A7X5HU75_9FIRM|nr:transcriptional repressor [Anaerotalea alkaliphila]NDL66758.1 transcriptional repressor [Anaerotalea alkaliphila]
MERLAEILKAKKLKVTPQRLAIYKVLYETTAHPTADVIYNALKATHPTMSLATVYKTLDALKKADLVHELSIGDESARYDANMKSHPHMVCLHCNKVYDLHTSTLDDAINNLQSETDFEILSTKIYFYGICSGCKTATLS